MREFQEIYKFSEMLQNLENISFFGEKELNEMLKNLIKCSIFGENVSEFGEMAR